MRMTSIVLALALAAGTLLLVQQPAEAVSAAPVAAAIAGGDTVTAQLNIGELIRSIVCPILLAVRNAFVGSPFFSFVDAILQQLLQFFGCTPSG